MVRHKVLKLSDLVERDQKYAQLSKLAFSGMIYMLKYDVCKIKFSNNYPQKELVPIIEIIKISLNAKV